MSDSSDSDYTLLQRICDGDQAAFQAIYERHGLVLLNYLIHLTRNHQQSEDVLQEVMLIVWEKANTFRPVGEVRGWLFGIAKRQAFKAIRKRHGHLPLHDETVANDDNLQSETMRRIALKTAIRTLPPVEQQALEMVYYHGMTLTEVAEALNVPLNTVKTRLHRARQRLRAYLMEDPHAR